MAVGTDWKKDFKQLGQFFKRLQRKCDSENVSLIDKIKEDKELKEKYDIFKKLGSRMRRQQGSKQQGSNDNKENKKKKNKNKNQKNKDEESRLNEMCLLHTDLAIELACNLKLQSTVSHLLIEINQLEKNKNKNNGLSISRNNDKRRSQHNIQSLRNVTQTKLFFFYVWSVIKNEQVNELVTAHEIWQILSNSFAKQNNTFLISKENDNDNDNDNNSLWTQSTIKKYKNDCYQIYRTFQKVKRMIEFQIIKYQFENKQNVTHLLDKYWPKNKQYDKLIANDQMSKCPHWYQKLDKYRNNFEKNMEHIQNNRPPKGWIDWQTFQMFCLHRIDWLIDQIGQAMSIENSMHLQGTMANFNHKSKDRLYFMK